MRRLCHAQPLNNRKRTRNALSRVVRSGGVVPYPHSKTVILPYANGYPGFYLMVFFFSPQYSSYYSCYCYLNNIILQRKIIITRITVRIRQYNRFTVRIRYYATRPHNPG